MAPRRPRESDAASAPDARSVEPENGAQIEADDATAYTCPWGCGETQPFRVDVMEHGDTWPRCPTCGGN